MITVYGDMRSGNCYKIALLLYLLDRPFQWADTDIMAGETRTDSFLALNPNGKIPLIQFDDGEVLSESNAILYRLAHDSALFPTDLKLASQVMQWLFYEQYSHEPFIATSRYIVLYLGNPASHQQQLSDKRAGGETALKLMNEHLSNRSLLVGDELSIADVALYAYTHVAEEGLFDLAPYLALRDWLARVEAQPGFVSMNAASERVGAAHS